MMIYDGITMVRYSLSILCGVSIITLLMLLYYKKKEFYTKSIFFMLLILLCLIASDFICFRLPIVSRRFEEILNWNRVACISELFYYVLIGIWILLLGKLTEKGTIVPEKTFFVLIAAGAFAEGMLHFSVLKGFCFITYIVNIIIICYAVFYIVSSIRNYNKLKPKGIAAALSVLLLAYVGFTFYNTCTVYSALLNGLEPSVPHNPLVEVAFLIYIIILIYFKKADPLEVNVIQNNIDTAAVEQSEIELCEDKYELTSREMDVLRLIVNGCTTPQIAQELFLSESTVKKHITNIFKKTNVSNRYELIIKVK